MVDHVEQLKAFPKARDVFVGIDSDGCAFDTMEVKHKECFIPNIINSWDLQAVCRYAREAAEFVNLYSRWRGINRFPALLRVFDLLAERPEALQRGYAPPAVDPLRAWVARETRLGNTALAEEVARTHDAVLERALAWSTAVNETVAKIVRGVPPFPCVRESLQKLAPAADIIVCSATPNEALKREWREHGIAAYAGMICGQEMGTKAEHLEHAAGGKYAPQNVLMIGDAPGDLKAAKANGFLFYPVNPGDESASWRRFYEEAADRFLAGRYAGDYEQALIDAFLAHLPSQPPWQR
jgi:phosphoglycolate phosphatase-like HAD superfamily hydrolase